MLKINEFQMKLLGKRVTLFRVIHNQHLLQICETREAAEAWVSKLCDYHPA